MQPNATQKNKKFNAVKKAHNISDRVFYRVDSVDTVAIGTFLARNNEVSPLIYNTLSLF